MQAKENIFTKSNIHIGLDFKTIYDATQNRAFGLAHSICEPFRLSGVNCRDYIIVCHYYRGKSGRAAKNHGKSQAQNSRDFRELNKIFTFAILNGARIKYIEV